MDSDLKVLFLAAEAAPFTKVGELADVAGALPQALRRLGVDVRVMIPRYGNLRGEAHHFHRIGNSIPVPVGADLERVHLLETMAGDVPVYLIWNDQYFANRERVYGFNDDPQRFVFFSRAVIAVLGALEWKPDIVHANDWHTAAVPAWLDVYGKSDPLYKDVATLFTIHNVAYQGVCGRLILSFGQMAKVEHLSVEPPGQVNWLAQGIAHADLVSTVSSTYAHELLSGELDAALAPLLQEKQDRVFGILGGIAPDVWDPSNDSALAQTYDADSVKMRAVNKTAFQREARLRADVDIPLVGIVTRLDTRKDLDTAIPVMEALLEDQELQFLVLGLGESVYENQLLDFKKRFPNNVCAQIKLDDRMERRIYGSVDLFVLPGQIEPSGLSQMTAMRYGAIPVVRTVDGVADTVVDVGTKPAQGTGFTFSKYTPEAVKEALKRALIAYGDKACWVAIQQRAMKRDFSWTVSAHAYIDLYRRAVVLHKGG